jgi:hypothetical protein
MIPMPFSGAVKDFRFSRPDASVPFPRSNSILAITYALARAGRGGLLKTKRLWKPESSATRLWVKCPIFGRRKLFHSQELASG